MREYASAAQQVALELRLGRYLKLTPWGTWSGKPQRSTTVTLYPVMKDSFIIPPSMFGPHVMVPLNSPAASFVSVTLAVTAQGWHRMLAEVR